MEDGLLTGNLPTFESRHKSIVDKALKLMDALLKPDEKRMMHDRNADKGKKKLVARSLG